MLLHYQLKKLAEKKAKEQEIATVKEEEKTESPKKTSKKGDK